MKLFATLTLALVLSGCASSKWGNFADQASAATNQALAKDAVSQLVAVFPPASTRLNLVQPTPDAFGQDLVAALRARGFSVQEQQLNGQAQQGQGTNQSSAQRGLALSYVVDMPPETNLYRVSLKVGYQTLTRAYVAQNNTVQPAGAWTRKE